MQKRALLALAANHRQRHEENPHDCCIGIYECLTTCINLWDPDFFLIQLAHNPTPTSKNCQYLMRELYESHEWFMRSTRTTHERKNKRDAEFKKMFLAVLRVYTGHNYECRLKIQYPRQPLTLFVADINPLLFEESSRKMRVIKKFAANKKLARQNCCVLLGSKYLPQLTQKLHRDVLPIIARVVWENRGVVPK